MIEIKDLEKNYGSTKAVKGINLSINSGEILGLLGPNGAGKSSTLRILTGYLKPSSGTIFVKGLDVRESELEIKKLIGYLPESAPLYSEMLVYDYLIYIANLRGLDSENIEPRLKELADLCGIRSVMHKSINSLSKGYKQRVGLAQAMMDDPEILVLDEPTTGLDPNQIVEIRNIIREIGKTKTVIFSTHILSEAEATCDRIVIINSGVVAADGTPAQLKQMMEGDSKVELTLKNSNIEDLERLLSQIPQIESYKIMENNNNLDVSIFAKEDLRETLYLKIKDTNWILLSLSLEVKSLENIFRKLTREQIDE
ncbi:ATP-binding cassette domain-containing protein [Thiospirochaeta perfilievii]|uniref:ATP-binding cassette domain-containing protein n=1 Tax=Thiospirochaeta perfilievii TaxID=252967 RepID=A0A5C1QAY5_9SPIO|nr:ATP-binding cassette domain-containing protein [Thiospirochaeta perfilievii]QEN04681.1 ATP-binding cassette domain-containing protein [Thiospirochaeta perfilievii]